MRKWQKHCAALGKIWLSLELQSPMVKTPNECHHTEKEFYACSNVHRIKRRARGFSEELWSACPQLACPSWKRKHFMVTLENYTTEVFCRTIWKAVRHDNPPSATEAADLMKPTSKIFPISQSFSELFIHLSWVQRYPKVIRHLHASVKRNRYLQSKSGNYLSKTCKCDPWLQFILYPASQVPYNFLHVCLSFACFQRQERHSPPRRPKKRKVGFLLPPFQWCSAILVCVKKDKQDEKEKLRKTRPHFLEEQWLFPETSVLRSSDLTNLKQILNIDHPDINYILIMKSLGTASWQFCVGN